MASQSPFQGKAIAVTGDTGLAPSRYPVVRGATVSIYATSADNLAAAIAGIEEDMPKARGGIMSTVVDIRKLETVKAWIDTTVERFGKLNGAVNVAGHSPPLSFLSHISTTFGIESRFRSHSKGKNLPK
ncbi:Putative short-chain dehydrogenase/reductase SDR, NAD(P)-binding domain superfamily [Colletotrichum destructivum]|uniref:Short-chain dehydrogenase/reductase SDR, NAD(P)-binding domain superfamily n=1 Tax=Colletotrichum destructivum TaxID=34406 RepID=A0AAX4IA73_9PEZI|nr:Putative short-chain dehydrogenase/reductase SDR, NAD(P)-binding domain superfamily [Colletotrichum destructivum]